IRSEPVVTYALIAINVVAWIAEVAAAAGQSGGGWLYEHGALFGPLIDNQSEYWRLVTGGFLHDYHLPFGILHIGFNMYILYYLGTLLEPAIGRVRFLSLYVASLLCGSFGALLLTPNSPTVGASGAVFGLMGGAVIVMRARGMDPWRSPIVGLLVVEPLRLLEQTRGREAGAHVLRRCRPQAGAQPRLVGEVGEGGGERRRRSRCDEPAGLAVAHDLRKPSSVGGDDALGRRGGLERDQSERLGAGGGHAHHVGGAVERVEVVAESEQAQPLAEAEIRAQRLEPTHVALLARPG